MYYTRSARDRIRLLMRDAGLTPYHVAQAMDAAGAMSFKTAFRYIRGEADTVTEKADIIEQYLRRITDTAPDPLDPLIVDLASFIRPLITQHAESIAIAIDNHNEGVTP